MSTKFIYITIAVGILVIAVAGYINRDFYMGTDELAMVEKQRELMEKKIDPKNKEQLAALRAQIKGYVDEARADKTDYSKMSEEELIVIETTLLTEIGQQITNSVNEYKKDEEISTFERVRPALMRNAGKWGRIIKQRDLIEDKEGLNESRVKHAEEIKKALTVLGDIQGKSQTYAEGMLNGLMFKRILDEVSERGGFTSESQKPTQPPMLTSEQKKQAGKAAEQMLKDDAKKNADSAVKSTENAPIKQESVPAAVK